MKPWSKRFGTRATAVSRSHIRLWGAGRVDLVWVPGVLGHSSIQTTGDVYADWDIDQLADTMRAVLEGEK